MIDGRDIGCVIIARNEGEEVRRTVASLKQAGDYQIIVNDDGSVDESCYGLNGAATVLHQAEPIGVGRGRNQGARHFQFNTAATVFLDAHMRVRPELLEALCQASLDLKAPVCASMGSVDVRMPLDYEDCLPKMIGDYQGAYLIWSPAPRDDEVAVFGIQAKYRSKAMQKEKIDKIPCMMGACYAFPTELLFSLGGWLDVVGNWGFSEQAMAIACFFQDVSTYCYDFGGRPVMHLYKGTNPEGNAAAHYWFNYALACRMLFEPETFARVLAPIALANCGDPRIQQIIEDPDLDARRGFFTNQKQCSDAEFFEEMLGQDLEALLEASAQCT